MGVTGNLQDMPLSELLQWVGSNRKTGVLQISSGRNTIQFVVEEGKIVGCASNDPPTLLGQFLSTALGSICRSAGLAPSIVGTVQDLRDLVAFRLGIGGRSRSEPPSLARGWRAQVVGHVIDELLEGKTAIRVGDPLSENPLTFEQTEPAP